jgi:hypothetical protein
MQWTPWLHPHRPRGHVDTASNRHLQHFCIYFCRVLSALSYLIHLIDLSCGVDQLQCGTDAVRLIAVPIVTPSSKKAAAKFIFNYC